MRSLEEIVRDNGGDNTPMYDSHNLTGRARRHADMVAGWSSVLGVPYAQERMHPNGKDGLATCPACGVEVTLIERKDFESFSGREYADHFQRLAKLEADS